MMTDYIVIIGSQATHGTCLIPSWSHLERDDFHAPGA